MDLIELPEGEKSALFPVGRLDRGTTGVLLLTNDGDLAHRLMHPRYGVEKLYVVTTARPVKPHELARLREGVPLEDGPAQADHAAYVGDDPREVAVQIHEGRNRQVRRMFEALGHTVEALDRTHYAGLDLQRLRRGRWRRLEPHEINMLRRKVKLKPIVF
jgi:23S rRNA pseudouridine2605 synthase